MNVMPSHKTSIVKHLFAALVFAGMSACAQPGASLSDIDSLTAAESITARYPEGAFQSVETADRALAEVRSEREKIRRQFALEERDCYERFFTNRCLDDVKNRERSALEQLRSVEVEANAYKRRESVARRDERAQQREKRRLQRSVESKPVNNEPEPGQGKSAE